MFPHQTTRRSTPTPCGSANSTKQPGLSHSNGPPTATFSEAKQRERRAIAQRLERTQARYVYAVDRLTAGDSPELADWAWAIHCTVEGIEAGIAMRNKDDVASISAELLELPLASRQEILTALQAVGTTGGTKNGSKSKPGAMTEKLGPHLLEWHTMAEIVALAGIEKRRAIWSVGGLFGAGKLVTKGAKGPNRKYRWNPAAKQAWQEAHPAVTADS